jgi:hypothetical protein
MKRVTASEARRSWFRLLDEILAGQVVVIERRGQRVVLRREEGRAGQTTDVPDYTGLVRGAEVERADEWGWEWESPDGDVRPTGPQRDHTPRRARDEGGRTR